MQTPVTADNRDPARAAEPQTIHYPRAVQPIVSPVVWVVGQALLEPGEEPGEEPDEEPDGLTPFPWSMQGVFGTETEAVAACRGPLWFVGPMTMGECLPVENVRWDGAYYPMQE